MKKNLILAAAALAATGIIVGQTVAYFTSTQTQTNTFTVGDLEIEETEPAWDDATDGKDMYPGTTLYKDPTVKNITSGEAGGEPGYFRMYVEVKDTASGARVTDNERLGLILDTIRYDKTYDQAAQTAVTLKENKKPGYALSDLTGIPHFNTDEFEEDTSRSSSGLYCYNYKSTLGIGQKATLFTHVVIPTEWNQTQMEKLGSYKLDITVEAIQSKGFNNASEAFLALDQETRRS